MFEKYEPIEQRLVKAMLKNEIKPDIILLGTSRGFEVFIRHGKKLFRLYTQRKLPRVFRSPNTAINFLAELGAERIVIDCLNNWKPDSYINQSSRPKRIYK
ncbi:hypothetical protein [Candidatus Enterovibrio escicola]|uniref:hypothetical protein n=1 Tax=Candidatus Enterovibrio escicola TaxID=1927127 RepID=UPI001237AC77|nr:hypothetical protein [Candidatus Enterovibrio escacola]